MPKKKDAPKKVALKESGHKANMEGKKIPMVGSGPDEKSKAMHKKQLHAPAKEGNTKMDIPYGKHPMSNKDKTGSHSKASSAHEKPSIPYGKHPMNKPAGPHQHAHKKKSRKDD